MKTITRILLLTFAMFILGPAKAVDMDDFVPADGETITTTLITNGAVTSDKIVADAVTADKIAADAVGSSEIATDAVGSAEIAADAVTASEIAADAVGSSEIATDAVGSAEIATDAVGSSEIVSDAVGSSEIAADAVGSAEIATDAVTASEIAAGAVANSELAADAVTSAKIADGTIVAADLAANVISTLGTKYDQLEIGAGTRTSLTVGTVGSGYGAAPVLRYDSSGTSYSRWTMPVPDDYTPGTDIIVELIWSPSNTSVANVVWELDYASLAAGEVVPGSAGFTAKTYTQATSGTTLALASTGDNLTINAADIAANDTINLVVLRDPGAVADTYSNDANVHLVKIKYTAKKVN